MLNSRKTTITKSVFTICAFVIPFSLFFFTRSSSLGFSDAAEFALVTKLGSIAHGPGFPAYVFGGWVWSSALSTLGGSHFFWIQLFSIVCMAMGSAILYTTASRIAGRLTSDIPYLYLELTALLTALTFSVGFTTWYWSNNIEVYAFQLCAFAIMLLGAIEYNHSRQTKHIVIAAIGFALGLANHHLTTLLFVPFLGLFAGHPFFEIPAIENTGTKKKKAGKEAVPHPMVVFFTSRHFLFFIGFSLVITSLFYGWMMYRASLESPFKFGNPDTFSRLLKHVSGAAWSKRVGENVEGIIGMRVPYFAWLFVKQFGGAILLLAIGATSLAQKKKYVLPVALAGYFLLVLFYQLRLNQVGDSDAYMLMPYYGLALLLPFGMLRLMEWKKEILVLIMLAVAGQAAWVFPLADKRDFDLSQGQMKTLSESAAPNSTIFVTDWTMLSEYYYYRLVEGFRTDLIVLHQDIKFANAATLKVLYPEFYELVKPEYELFINELAKAHPEQVYDTGCDIDNPALANSFNALLRKISTVGRERKGQILFDANSFVFFAENKLITSRPHVSGCFMAYDKTDLPGNYITLPYKWLDLPATRYEPATEHLLVDFYVMLSLHLEYYAFTGDDKNRAIAQHSYDRILALQKEIKGNVPFIFRNEGMIAKWK